MNMNKLTQKTIDAINKAQSLAIEYGHQSIAPEHLLSALLSQEDGLIPNLLTKAGANPEAVLGDTLSELSKIPSVSGPGREAVPGARGCAGCQGAGTAGR